MMAKRKKAVFSQSSGNTSSSQSSGGGDSLGKDSGSDQKKQPGEEKSHQPPNQPPTPHSQRSQPEMAAQLYMLKAGDVVYFMEKSALPTGGKQPKKKLNQITVARASDGATIKLTDIERNSLAVTASHLAGQGDALDYLLRYGIPDSLRDYHRFNAKHDLPEQELVQATPAIITALTDRPQIVSLLKLSGEEAPLHTAVSRGLVTCTELLLGLHYPIDEPLSSGETLLHIAVPNQDEGVIQQLLNWHADPNIRRVSDGLTPFHLAIKGAYVTSATLLASHADKNMKSLSGEFPWQMVPSLPRERSHDQELLRKLVEPDDPNAPENFEQFIADIQAGRAAQVINFIKTGVNFNVFWEDKSPLHIAVEAGHPDTVKALLHYINPSEEQLKEGSGLSRMLNGLTISKEEAPLHLAVKGIIGAGDDQEKVKRYLEIMKALLDNGVKADIPRGSDGSTPLILAARGGSVVAVSALKNRLDVDKNRARLSDQMTPLHAAVESGNIKLVTSLLREGANTTAIMHRDGQELYPLDIALEKSDAEMIKTVGRQSWFLFDYCKTGELELVRHYLKAGVPSSLERPGAYSLLHQAAKGGNDELIHLLVNNGADINKTYSDGVTPLHIAAKHGPLGVVTAITHYNNAVLRKNSQNKTPLDEALNNHQGQIASHLLGHYFPTDPNPDSGKSSAPQSQHPLISAVINGDKTFIEQLIYEGCLKGDMPVDRDDNTPLHLAALLKRVEIIPLLIRPGLHEHLNKKLQTPLSAAFSTEDDATIRAFKPLMNPSLFLAARNGHGFHIEMILMQEIAFDPVGTGGDYPLHVAARSGQSDCVRILLKGKPPFSKIDKQNNAGKTPIEEALDRLAQRDENLNKNECRAIIQLLLDAENGHTLFQAARENKTGLIERLLNTGVVDVNRVDQYGETALHKAAKRGQMDAVQLLRKNGAVNRENNRGDTPYRLARRNQHRDVARLLDDGPSCPLL